MRCTVASLSAWRDSMSVGRRAGVHHTSRTLTGVLVTILLTSACAASGSTPSNEEREAPSDSAASRAVDSTIARLTTSVLAGNVDATLQDFADDYVSLEEPGKVARKEPYRAFMDSLFKAGRITELVFEPIGKHFAGNLAVHYGDWRMTFTPTSGSPSSVKGNYMHVYRHEPDGVWRLVTEISNVIPPPAAATNAATRKQ